jgi:maleate isomerase
MSQSGPVIGGPPAIDTLDALRKLGHITPSCNSALEPLTAMLTSSIAGQVSNHFTRIPVTSISLSDDDLDQFDVRPMVEAAELLAEAPIHAIAWNGTSGSWTGPEHDRKLSEAITEATGLPATTSTLAQLDILRRHGIERVAIATPYTDDVSDKIDEVYASEGYEVVRHSNLGLSVGKEMANVPRPDIAQLVRDADSPDAQAIAIVCTGLPATLLVEELEAELGKPVFDSIAVTVKRGLELAGVDAPVQGWGALMEGSEAVDELLGKAEVTA